MSVGSQLGLLARGQEVTRLHAVLRAAGQDIALSELSGSSFGVGTRDAVLRFQCESGIAETGILDDATYAELEKRAASKPKKGSVVGRISGLPDGAVALRLYRHGFDNKPRLLGRTEVQKDGYYAFDYKIPDSKDAVHIELKADYSIGKKKKTVSLTGIKYDASPYEVLNLSMPSDAQPPRTEHQGILEALRSKIGANGKLEELREDENRKDLTYLSRSALLDPENLVLAASAAQMGKKMGVDPGALYGLFRYGLPADEEAVAFSDPEKLKEALAEAEKSGFMSLDKKIATTVRKIANYGRSLRLDLKADGAMSSIGDLLAISGLTAKEKEAFHDAFFAQRGSTAAMWMEAEKKLLALGGKGKRKASTKAVKRKIAGLKTQGKLAHLTGGNAPLIEKVQASLGSRDIASLAHEGFDKPEKWQKLIRELSGKDGSVKDYVPPSYRGKDVQEQLRAYAEDMAGMIRESFPLQVVRRKLQDEELQISFSENVPEEQEIERHVIDFLDKAEALGFQIGATPLGRFIKENEDGLFALPMNPSLKASLVKEEKEKLGREDARVFIRKNWARVVGKAAKDAPKEGKADRAVMRALKKHVKRSVTIGEFPAAALGKGKFSEEVGAFAAESIKKSLAGFLKETEQGLPDQVEGAFRNKVKGAAKKLVRLHQVSPDDDALQVLYRLGLGSAGGITRFSSSEFAEAYMREARKPGIPGMSGKSDEELRATAETVHGKAWLIHATVLNVAVAAGQSAGSSLEKISGGRAAWGFPLPVAGGGVVVPAQPADTDLVAMGTLIRQYPTMEELLGSQDFCECQECQSVLSPAAYLVDLFRFLEHTDPNPYDSVNGSWGEFKNRWKTRHGAEYPFKSAEKLARWRTENPGQQPFLELTPYQILLKHRPDLPHLPLTCENTNTLVPYIDLVNEILEYYIMNPDKAGEDEEDLLEEFVRYDTGKLASEDLVAEPQNILPEAYETLKEHSCYPLTLPFDLWLATVRLFFSHFETPLWEALEAFSPLEGLALFPPAVLPADPPSYYQAQIFSEYLEISPQEYDLFTDPSVREWFELYGYSVAADAVRELKSARTLSRRLGVTYKELVEIVKARFINPGLRELEFVWKLGIEISDAVEYFEQRGNAAYATKKAGFESKLDEAQARYSDYFDTRATTVLAELEALWPDGFREVLVLRDKPPGTASRVVGCDFEWTFLEYAAAQPGGDFSAAVSDWVRINFFVRLWRKLGWTIEETDWALTSLWPRGLAIQLGQGNAAQMTARRSSLAEGFRTVLPYLAHLKFLNEKLGGGKAGRQKLLALWADIPTAGRKSLYSQLFLGTSLVKNFPNSDSIFDDPFGDYLSDGITTLADQLTVLQGSLGMTDQDMRLVVCDAASRPLEFAEELLSQELLTLPNVSLLYRHGLFAKLLGLGVKDMIALKSLSGVDPFLPLVNGSIATLDQDRPLVNTIRFAEIARELKESRFKIEDVDFLVRHNFDPLGKYRFLADGLPGFLSQMSAGIKASEKELAAFVTLPPSDEQFQEKLALLLPRSSAEKLAKILAGAFEIEAVSPEGPGDAAPAVPDSAKLEPADFLSAPDVRVAHDSVRQAQRLFFKGFLTGYRKTELLALVDDVPSGESALLERLLERIRENAGKAFASALWELLETMEFSAVMAADPAWSLQPELFEDFPLDLFYDKENEVQHLTFKGLLTEGYSDEIIAALGLTPSLDRLDLLEKLLAVIRTGSRRIFDALAIASTAKLLSTVEFGVALAGAQLDDATLEKLEGEEAIGGLRYDEDSTVQYFSYRGVLNSSERTRLAALGANMDLLLQDIGSQQVELIGYLRSGFLAEADFDSLFDFNGDGTFTADDLDKFPVPEEATRSELASALLPMLRKQAAIQFVSESFAAETGADIATVRTLLSEPTFLPDPSQTRKALSATGVAHYESPLLAAFSAAGEEGVDAFFMDAADSPILVGGSASVRMPAVDTFARGADGVLFRPAGTESVRFEGWFRVPTDGTYRLFIVSSVAGPTAEFRFGDASGALRRIIMDGSVAEASSPQELKAGVLYFFTFEAAGLASSAGSDLDVSVEIVADNLARSNLKGLKPYPPAAVNGIRDARTLMVKVLQIVRTLSLSGREVKYLLTNRTLFDHLDFGLLAFRPAQTELERIARKIQAEAVASGNLPVPWSTALGQARTQDPQLARDADAPPRFFKGFLRLLKFAALKRELSPDSDDLISVMENAVRTYYLSENPEWNDQEKVKTAHFSPAASLMRREPGVVLEMADCLRFDVPAPTSVTSAATGLNMGWRMQAPDLATEKGIGKLWEALRITERFGLSAAGLADALKIVQSTADGFPIARDLRNAVKARYGAEDWRLIVKGISDELRRKKRDSLIAFISGKWPEVFTTPDKLFEYFLVDPGMEPVVKTSRVRLALESIRRFIQRCLDGKETWVSPSAIDKEQWKVRGRFRLWQANRRIFLHPENWLEPEFRDDKSHLFQELEATLLQGEVSEELVEDAVFKYLKGLEEIARLEIMSVYQETAGDPHEGWFHVIARAQNLPHKYFYRRYDGSEWTPWEPVNLEIEGDNVIAIVWKQRLHLFWVTFMERAADPEANESGDSIEDMAKTENPQITKKRIDGQLNWSDYFQGEWRTRQASNYMDAVPDVDVAGLREDLDRIVVYAEKESSGGEDGAIRIHYGLLIKRIETSSRTESETTTQKKFVPAERFEWNTTNSIPYPPYNGPVTLGGLYYAWFGRFGYLRILEDDDSGSYYVIIPSHEDSTSTTESSSYDRYRLVNDSHSGAFQLTSRNAPVEIVDGRFRPNMPYGFSVTDIRIASRYFGKGGLEVAGKTILNLEHAPPAAAAPLPASIVYPDVTDASPAIGGYGYGSAAQAAVRSFFYQDDQNVFFVQPTPRKTLDEVEVWGGRDGGTKKPKPKTHVRYTHVKRKKSR